MEKLSERVVCVLGQNPSDYTLNGTNTYLVGTGKRRILIEAAEEGQDGCLAVAYVDNLERAMRAEGVEGLELILLTHLHGDHNGGVREIRRRFGDVPVASFFYPTELLEELRVAGHPWSQWYADRLRDWQAEPWARPVCDGEIFTTEGATLLAKHTPGHANEHLVFYLREEKALFTGDNVLGHGTTVVMNAAKYNESLRLMRSFSREAPHAAPLRLFPAHGPSVRDGERWIGAYEAHRRVREERVAATLRRGPIPAKEVAAALYPSATTELAKGRALENVLRILELFEATGAASCRIPETATPPAVPLNRFTWQQHHQDSVWTWNLHSRL